MKLSISISYEVDSDPGENKEINEAVTQEVVEAKAAEFAGAISDQLEAQGITNIRMSMKG
jgi:hypothetical protein